MVSSFFVFSCSIFIYYYFFSFFKINIILCVLSFSSCRFMNNLDCCICVYTVLSGILLNIYLRTSLQNHRHSSNNLSQAPSTKQSQFPYPNSKLRECHCSVEKSVGVENRFPFCHHHCYMQMLMVLNKKKKQKQKQLKKLF